MTDDRSLGDLRLGQRGQIFVSLAAARRYAEQRRLAPETARRELTELLLDARLTAPGSPGSPALYRLRSRTKDIDLSACVVVEGRLLVVISINARHRYTD